MHSRGAPKPGLRGSPLPEVRDGDALIGVRATGMTPTELAWASTFRTGEKEDRLPTIPGFEVAGTVEGARTACEKGLAGRNTGKTVLETGS